MNYVCVFCGREKTSENGTGSDVSCCGEVGHVMTQEEAQLEAERELRFAEFQANERGRLNGKRRARA